MYAHYRCQAGTQDLFLNNPCPLFFDEVQKAVGILENIKMIVDESDQRGMFILSGSQGLELMKGMSESLAGRVSITEHTGLSFCEIYGVKFILPMCQCILKEILMR